ncbi:MAG: SdrD B-like domain-containing protein [Candidatus Bathyarchaeia archaeon]
MLTILATSILVIFPVPAMVHGDGQNQGQAGTTLEANVTATGYWTKTFTWTIDKSVTPDTWHLFQGDSGTSNYTITVTKDSGTDKYGVSGNVTVTNRGESATEGLKIVVQVEYKTTGAGQFQPLPGASQTIIPNQQIPAGGSLSYDYSIEFTPVEGAIYRVAAKVTITNHSGHLDEEFGPEPKADFLIPSTPTQYINDVIHVDDTNGYSWTFRSSDSVSYEKTFSDKGTYTNIATIRETGQSDSVTVTVYCYALEISKTAETSYTRKYIWTIDKEADKSELTLEIGETYDVTYSVTVKTTTYIDSDWKVSGTITVYNPALIPVKINSIKDVVSQDIEAEIDGISFPYVLAAGGTLILKYTAILPDASNGINAVTVTIQNYNYKWDGTESQTGTTDFTATKDVDFSTATVTEVDESITVTDTLRGCLGTVSYYENAQKTFKYTIKIGPYEKEGEYSVENTASFTTCDTETTDSDSWTVTVTVNRPMPPGQTYEIYGCKFYDANANGEFDDGENGLGGWTIQLIDQYGNVATTTTGEDGRYRFEVTPGTYTVREVMKSGWVNTTPIEVPVTVENANVEVNFGNIQRITTNARTIGYWKNWLQRFSDNYVLQLANDVKSDWNTFDSVRTDSGSNARKDMIGVIDKANAKDMSVMLKAQLLGMMLNIKAGYVDPNTYVYLGSIRGASDLFGGNFKKVGEVVCYVDSNWSGWSRLQQEIAKNVLDAMNNNLIFVG